MGANEALLDFSWKQGLRWEVTPFLMFSVGIKREHWEEMPETNVFFLVTFPFQHEASKKETKMEYNKDKTYSDVFNNFNTRNI